MLEGRGVAKKSELSPYTACLLRRTDQKKMERLRTIMNCSDQVAAGNSVDLANPGPLSTPNWTLLCFAVVEIDRHAKSGFPEERIIRAAPMSRGVLTVVDEEWLW